MMKLKMEGKNMLKKWGIICTICVVVGIVAYKTPIKPKIVTSVRSLDSVYLTILVNLSEKRNLEKLEETIRELCEEDVTSYVSVFDSKWALRYGQPVLQIKNDAEK